MEPQSPPSNLPVVPSTDTIQEIAFGGVAGVAVVAVPALFLYAAVFPSTGPVAGSIAANCMRLLHQRRSKKTRERLKLWAGPGIIRESSRAALDVSRVSVKPCLALDFQAIWLIYIGPADNNITAK